MNLGFTQADAEVYVSLAEHGSQRAREIAEALKTYRQQVYRSLKNLKAKGIVNASTDHPAQFSAISFEKVLDLHMKANVEEARRVEQNRDELLTKWQTLLREKS
jgi:sugar-specific transcriptional regulator TrmB